MLGMRGWRTVARSVPLFLAGRADRAGRWPVASHPAQPTSGDTFRFLFGNVLETRLYGHNNLDVLNNLAIVVREFMRVMGGDTLHFQAPAGLASGRGSRSSAAALTLRSAASWIAA